VYRNKIPLLPAGEQEKYLYQKFDWTTYPVQPVNVGFVTGAVSGNLIVVDFDSEIIARAFFPKFDEAIRSTMTAKTGRGYHFYYRLETATATRTASFYRAGDRDERGRPKACQSISVKAEGGYVVGPGSMHPNGKVYELLNDVEPLLLDDSTGFIASFMRKVKKIAKDNEWGLTPTPQAEKDPESMTEYVRLLPKIEELVGDGLTRAGNELYGAHPLHGSETGKNFHVNIEKQVFYCFRCQAGGGVLSWLAVKHGLIDCKDAAKFPKKRYPELFEKIMEIYHVSPPVVEKEKNYTTYMEENNKIIEEIWDPTTGTPRFVVFDFTADKFEYQTSYTSVADEVYPLPLEPGESRSLALPNGVLEYGTLCELRKEMLEWALEEFDPVSNSALFELAVNLALTSWLTEWQEGFGEKFLPIIQAVGPSETGKKRFLTVMRFLYYRSIYALKTTKVPSLFRLMEKWKGTLVLDEADLDDSTLSAEFVQFVNSRADGVPITRYSAEDDVNKWFYSFGYTILAMRKTFMDDGAQSRCLKYVSEGTNTPSDYNLIPPKEWVERGEKIRQKLMMFRLRALLRPHKFPTQLIIEGVSSFRVREAVLMLYALEDVDPTITKDIPRILKLLQKQTIEERSGSIEGLVLNTVYGWIDEDDVVITKRGTEWYAEKLHTSVNREGKQTEWSEPLTLGAVSKSLNECMSSSEVARYWRGMGQNVLSQLKTGGRRIRGVLMIKDSARLQKEFRKYVVDAEDFSTRFETVRQSSIEEVKESPAPPPPPSEPVGPKPPETASLKLTDPLGQPPKSYFENIDTTWKKHPPREPEEHNDDDQFIGGG
jgi:hypothetical protein